MTEHSRRKAEVRSVGDKRDIEEAIKRCNLKPEHRRLLEILYLDGGSIDDVCDAVGREYTTVSKWHKSALIKLCYILRKSGKL